MFLCVSHCTNLPLRAAANLNGLNERKSGATLGRSCFPRCGQSLQEVSEVGHLAALNG
jgi:hypothetical protein